jgi:hypothetical protein
MMNIYVEAQDIIYRCQIGIVPSNITTSGSEDLPYYVSVTFDEGSKEFVSHGLLSPVTLIENLEAKGISSNHSVHPE